MKINVVYKEYILWVTNDGFDLNILNYHFCLWVKVFKQIVRANIYVLTERLLSFK
jgi:hypothetical protein